MVTGLTFGPATVSVDGTDYTVEAAADEKGIVTTTVTPVGDAEAEVEALAEARATYTAAVAATVLDGLFERPGLEGLSPADEALAVDIPNASSSTLVNLFSEEYEALITRAALSEPLSRGEAVNPVEIEDFVLLVADKAARQYASLAASWSALEERVAGGEALSFEEALALQAEVAYAERILAPVATAGSVVRAAREAEGGWQNRLVAAMARELASGAACGARPDTLGFGELDAEIRASLPIFGYGVDAALCAALSADSDNARFLAWLGIESEALSPPDVPDVAEPEAEIAQPAPPPYELRVIARLREDGRVEHGVELNGAHILPPDRLLPVETPAGVWYVSDAVEVDGSAIGVIRARRLADGRIELGFRAASGEAIEPQIRFVADLPLGVFVRSSVIEVPRPPAPAADGESSE